MQCLIIILSPWQLVPNDDEAVYYIYDMYTYSCRGGCVGGGGVATVVSVGRARWLAFHSPRYSFSEIWKYRVLPSIPTETSLKTQIQRLLFWFTPPSEASVPRASFISGRNVHVAHWCPAPMSHGSVPTSSPRTRNGPQCYPCMSGRYLQWLIPDSQNRR